MPRDLEKILNNLHETVEAMEMGYADFVGRDPRRRITGLRNFVVFARAVTNVIQTAKSADPDFGNWYTTVQNRLKADAVARYFYAVRSEILKEGALDYGSSYVITNFDLGVLHRSMGPPPAGADGIFIGDSLGGSGWYVRNEDGSQTKYYAELPEEIATNIEHAFVATDLEDMTLNEAAAQYLKTIRQVVDETNSRYRRKPQ